MGGEHQWMSDKGVGKAVANYDNEYDDQYDDSGSDAISQVRKAEREARKRLKELEKELEEFRSRERVRSLSEVVGKHGLPSKVAELVPDYLTDPVEIDKWIEDRIDVFRPVGSEPASAESAPLAPPEGADRFRAAVDGGRTADADESTLIAQINAAKTPEDLNRLIFGSRHAPLN